MHVLPAGYIRLAHHMLRKLRLSCDVRRLPACACTGVTTRPIHAFRHLSGHLGAARPHEAARADSSRQVSDTAKWVVQLLRGACDTWTVVCTVCVRVCVVVEVGMGYVWGGGT